MATATNKMTHDQILALVSARNKYSGHTAKEDSKRLKVLVGQKDADIVKALNETLVEDFNSGFEGKGVVGAPKELVIYMTDVLGLGAEEEEEVEVEEEETEDEVVLEEEETEDEVTVEDDASGDDDDFNLDELDGGDDADAAVEVEAEEEEGDEPNLDDDFDMGEVEEEEVTATQTNGKHAVEAPKPAAKKQQVADVKASATGSEIEKTLMIILGALAEGHEIVIYKRPSAASVSAEVNSKKKVEKSAAPVEDKKEEKKVAEPKKKATAPVEAETPSGPAKATKKSIEVFVAGAYANTRKIVNEKFTNVKTKRIVCEALGIKPKSSRKKMSDYTDRALMNLLLTHVKGEATKFAKATPDKAQTRADGATWAMTILKAAASKAKAASTAAKK